MYPDSLSPSSLPEAIDVIDAIHDRSTQGLQKFLRPNMGFDLNNGLEYFI
jgi:hypothetical protein